MKPYTQEDIERFLKRAEDWADARNIDHASDREFQALKRTIMGKNDPSVSE